MKRLRWLSAVVFCVGVFLCVFSFPSGAYKIWMNGGNKGTYIHFHAWSGFAEETKHQFDLAFDEWNYKAGAAKPSSLWIDRSGIDTDQTTPFVCNNKNEITRGYRGTGNEKYTMATNATYSVNENGKNKLVEVDIDVNCSYPWVNSVQSGKLFVQSSFTHEVGHVYGLADVYKTDEYTGIRPTMYGYAEWGGRAKCTIESDDIAGMKAIYGG